MAANIAMASLPLLLFLCMGVTVYSDAFDQRYKHGDFVPLYATKIGPSHNPSETYRYYDMPFCSPEHVTEKKETFGEFLNGDHLVDAPYKLEFRVNKESEIACGKKLSKGEVAQFRNAILKDYYFQMYYDDLPIWSFFGRTEEGNRADEFKYLLYKNINFDILYNNNRVIEINVWINSSDTLDITEDKEIDMEFKYSVKWRETDISFKERMEKYVMFFSTHHGRSNWFLALDPCLNVLIFVGLFSSFIFGLLKKDIVRYSLDDEESVYEQEETGWKNIHGDVFRYPKHKSWFAAILGSGTQLLALAIFIFILGLVGVFYPYNKGVLSTALIVIYALTSSIAGYTATSFYCQLDGTNWVRCLLLTGCLFPAPLFLMFCFLNNVALVYNFATALPFSAIVAIVLMWSFVMSPLLVLGGIAGKNNKTEFQAPCRTTKCPREIPPLPWYQKTIPQMVIAGVLPFIAIYMELFLVLASMWGHKIYYTYGVLFMVFVVLVIVTAFVAIALVYFQLAAEDHEWWWRSVLRGGSTSLFIFGQCLYYYFARTDMSGLMQTSLFFGYMACICYGIFLLLGTVGFYISLVLVRYLYGSIKCE
ncbi:hypothetical protein AMTRI_Chr04g181310 [Amborella trichopoda]